MPRSSYSTFRHVAVTSRLHMLEAQSAIIVAVWRHIAGLLGLLAVKDFLRIFMFEPPDFFADFVSGFCLLSFVGISGVEKLTRSSLKVFFNGPFCL